ncbi:MAG: D-alanyl-D-alanine carboxypeptidase/D-alanyl-D-alanine-endopeptidase [Actinomycetota bacterium]|nr:D-alanyl-D-alanine carboxypeptidase/D-alanyl-D-alanine-endopeptidase [Actinomycetota bacterium]
MSGRLHVLHPLLSVLLCGTLVSGSLPQRPEATVAGQVPPAPSQEAETSFELPRIEPGELALLRPQPPPCVPHESLEALPVQPVPAPLRALVGEGVADGRLDGVFLGLSVWVEGYGVVARRHQDRPLLPASNQKVLIAMGVLATLPEEARLVTKVVGEGRVAGSQLQGDLVLVGGGDPTLTASGSHSLATLAGRVRGAGIEEVGGRLVVDETRYDSRRRAPGWLDFHVPAHIGPLSAITVSGNQYRSDDPFLADPATAAGELFREALAREGVAVKGPVARRAAAPGSRLIGFLQSPPVTELVRRMLTESDNTIAELLTKEVGYVRTGVGSTQAGLHSITGALRRKLCVPLVGTSGDGSGLSRQNRRSAREWRTLLQAAQAAPWWQRFSDSLPVAGKTGTLASRFLGTAAAGNLRAKTGTIRVGRALSGSFITSDGRTVFFSAIVNGRNTGSAMHAVDELLAELAAHSGMK